MRNDARRTFFLAFATASLVVFCGADVPTWVIAWNLVPSLLAGALAVVARGKRGAEVELRRLLRTPCFLALGYVAYMHLAWRFDWSGAASRSSTAGLEYLLVPIWAVVLWGAAAGLSIVLRGVWRYLRARSRTVSPRRGA
jgi:hypothetical protein